MTEKITGKKELLQKFRTEGILDAAIKVIAQKGLEKATMEQVAEEAGISKATIYLYFKNKETLYFTCVMDRFDDMLSAMKEAVKDIDDPINKIETLIAMQLRAIESDKEFFRVFLTERMGIFLDPSSEFAEEFTKKHDEYTDFMSGALKDGMDRGLLREIDPVKGFSLLFSMIRGMAMCKIIFCDKTPLSDEAGLISGVFFDGLRIK